MHDVFEGADGSCHGPRYRRHRIRLLHHEILNKTGFWRGHWLVSEGLHITIPFFFFCKALQGGLLTRKGLMVFIWDPRVCMVGMYSLFPHGSSRLASPECWTCVEDLVVKGGGGIVLFSPPSGTPLSPNVLFFAAKMISPFRLLGSPVSGLFGHLSRTPRLHSPKV